MHTSNAYYGLTSTTVAYHVSLHLCPKLLQLEVARSWIHNLCNLGRTIVGEGIYAGVPIAIDSFPHTLVGEGICCGLSYRGIFAV